MEKVKRGHIQVFFRPEIWAVMRKCAEQADLPITTWIRLTITKHAETIARRKKLAA
jgi:hypothetical protein